MLFYNLDFSNALRTKSEKGTCIMITKIKNGLKRFLSGITPLRIKKSLLDIWLESDDAFWLNSKIVINRNEDLFRSRFLWTDLEMPLQLIHNRFGTLQTIYLLTDRIDYPRSKGFQVVTLQELNQLNNENKHVVICAYESDENLLEAIRLINSKTNLFYYCPFRYLPAARYIHRNSAAKQILISQFKLKYQKFDLADFENIIQALEITRDRSGDFVEIGVYKGDSACIALEYMQVTGIQRKSYFFDLFEGFTNSSSEQSNDAVWLNSHIDTSLNKVEQLLNSYPNVTVGKLDIIKQELPSSITEIALCNIDVDIYEAVTFALRKVAPLVKKGGIIILEDQGHTPFLAGGFTATMDFIKTDCLNFIPIHLTSGQMYLIKL